MPLSSHLVNFLLFCYYYFILKYLVTLMHIISRKPFKDAAIKYPNDATALIDTYKALKKSQCKTPEGLRLLFPTLDNFKSKDKWWVINIGGNNLRLIAFIEFRDCRMYVRHITNHSDYDKLCKRYVKESAK